MDKGAILMLVAQQKHCYVPVAGIYIGYSLLAPKFDIHVYILVQL